MCEQSEVEYLPDEIVWVKLHQPSLWWPGQVQDYDKLPEDVTEGLRKKPIAIVKFFQEDTYEYVNNLSNIYRYNCSKKHDFIKKGLAMARSKRPERPSHMDLFPQDVATAETLTHGNPDIIRDDEFAPEEKPKYDSLFGSDKKKKAKSVVESILKERPSWRVKPIIAGSPKTPSSSPKPSKVITHPRFINKALKGETDYRIFIREQPVVEDETASPSSQYRCHSCDFVTSRLNVIVLHYRSHSKSVTPIPKTKPPKPKSVKSTVTKTKADTPVKSTPTEPLKKRNILKEKSPAPEEKAEKTSPKKSPKTPILKTQAPKRKAKPDKPEVEEKKAKKEEIQELLKDWSDEEIEEEPKIVDRKSDDASKEANASKMEVDEPIEPMGELCEKKPDESVENPVKDDKKEESKVEPVKKDGSKVEGAKKDESMVGGAKKDESKVKGAKKDESKVEGAKKDEIKVDGGKKDESKVQGAKKDESKFQDAKKNESKILGAKKDDSKKDDGKGKDDKKEEKSKQAKSKAVFDFDDDDEGLDPKLTQSTRVFGRKIPRVIDNMKERRISFPEHSPEREEEKNKEEKKKEGKKTSKEVADSCEKDTESANQEHIERQKELESMNAEIDSLLETTAVPELPEIPKLNTFSMDVMDDGQIPTKEEVKDKSVLREHFDNKISSNSVKESLEGGGQTEEPSKNSLPEVGSAVEEISTPPQADSVVSTAESCKVIPKIVKSAVVSSVIFSSPQSTSGGDHSYVSDKRPPVAKMPPLVPTSPKSPLGRSQTFVLSRPSPTKNRTSRKPEDAGVMRVVNVAPTTKTTKPIPSLVKKDGKYVIVRTTQSGDIKVMPSLTPTSSASSKVIAQTPAGKKLVILTKKPSGNVVLSSQKQASLVSNVSPKSSPVAKVSSSSVMATTSASSISGISPKTGTNLMTPKKNILLTAGGSRDAKTVMVPVSSINSSPGVFTSLASSGSKPVVLSQTVKLVGSKDSPGKVLLQMDSQKTRVTLPTMKKTVPQIRLVSKEATLAGSPPSLRMTLSSPPKLVSTVPSPKPLATLPSSKRLASPRLPALKTTIVSTKTLASPATTKPTTNKFFNREPTATPRPILKKQPVPMKKPVEVSNKPPAFAPPTQTKPSILSANRGNTKRSTPAKIIPRKSVTTKETKPEAVVVSSAPVPEPITPEATLGSSIVSAPIEGSVDSGTVMYILNAKDGTLISCDQVNQAESGGQGRTVFIDPASLSASSGDLSNLIFTFDELTGPTLLSLPQAEGTQPTEFAFAPAAGRPPATQDILAEALANTQVLQAEASASEMILDTTSLASNTIPSSSALYPNNVLTLSNNVLETSLTLNAPIMTPLEVPSAVSSLQPPPAASGSLELPISIAQPDITISTSSYASLPIPSATIQGTVFSDSTTATYSTIVPVLAGDADKETLYVEATNSEGASFDVGGAGATVFVCDDESAGEVAPDA